jgi:putative ABC transport system permease protein
VLRVTLRNLLARKVRLLLSAFAIILGVAFVAGTLVFTNAMGGAFDDIIEGSTSDVEVAYPGATDFDSFQDARTIDASVVEDLEALPEAAEVYPNVNLQNVYLIGEDGKVVGGNGPPGFGFNENGAINIAGEPIVEYVDGEPPSGPGQVALNEEAAEDGGYTVGDEVQVTTPGEPPVMTAELTGTVSFGSGTNGATLTIFETAAAQEQFLGGRDVFSSITIRAAEGVSQQELADAAAAVVPDNLQVRTGDEIVEVNKEGLDEVLGFITTFLLVFAGVALVVGIFLIINTFSILVAQRSRELALLRALGASRRQVNRSVILEAVVVGLVGSTVGLGVGYLLALGLRWLFGTFGLDLGDAAFPMTTTAVIASYAVGLVVTTIAGLLPARRASRIAPMAALRDDVALPEGALRKRVGIGLVLFAAGAALMASGFQVDDGTLGLSLIGGGILAMLVGVSLASAFLGRPLILAFGVVYRRFFGQVGNLATQNSLRNPRRTAATASALMIGLALMSLMAVFGASASASTQSTIERVVTSQYIISNVIGQPFSPRVAEQVSELDGVSSVASMRQAFVDVDGSGSAVGGIDPEAFGVELALAAQEGSLQDLRDGTVAVDAGAAEGAGIGIGDTVEVDFQAGPQELEVVALFPAGQGLGFTHLTTQQTLEDGGLAPVDAFVYVVKEPDADTDEVREAIEGVIADLPTVTVKDPEGYAAEQQEQINQFLAFIYGLLGLSVVIAILGVVNTLSLSVIERTREVGLLRAVGVTRRQLRRMITLESVVIAVFGGLLGVIMGTGFGSAVVIALEDQGLSDLAIPWTVLVTFVVVSGILGILAALFPAFRASRLNVLRAITVE